MAYTYELEHYCELDVPAAKAYSAIHNEPIEKNLGDVTQVDFKQMQGKVTALFGGSPCFPAGTKVLTDKGFVNIEDIRVGDRVLTHNNRYMPVDRIGGIHEETISCLRYCNDMRIYATGYHPFYVMRSYESNPEKVYLRDIQQGYYVASIVNADEKCSYVLSDAMWQLLGCCVGSGHLVDDSDNQYFVSLRLNENNIGWFTQLNVKYEIISHVRDIYEIAVYTSDVVNVLPTASADTSKGYLSVLHAVLSDSIEHIKMFLCGFVCSAEGEISDNNWILRARTKEAAMLLCSMIHKACGVGCSVKQTKQSYTQYTITFNPMAKEDRVNWFFKDGKIWYKVEGVGTTGYVAPTVYNIEVNTDHTYVADNLVVFNCQDFSNSGTKQGAVWTCNDCGYSYNPMSVAIGERQKCPNCAGSNLQHTRSSLLQYFLQALIDVKPNFAVYENVSALTAPRYSTVFKRFQYDLEDAGYCYETFILNCEDFGIPQHRERVFVVFVKSDLARPILPYLRTVGCNTVLGDYLDRNYTDRHYASEMLAERFQFTDCTFKKRICGTMIGEECTSYGQRYVVYHENSKMGTLMATDWKNPHTIFINHGRYKDFSNGKFPLKPDDLWRLEPFECWRLMGFSDKDYAKAADCGLSRGDLYRTAGNSIAVNVLFYLFKALYCSNSKLFDDVRILSLFSGIGAFEKALKLFIDEINSGKAINEIEFNFNYNV